METRAEHRTAKPAAVRRSQRETVTATALCRRRRRKDERPNEILAAALDEFAQKALPPLGLRKWHVALASPRADLPLLRE
jgi:hypothetical protein